MPKVQEITQPDGQPVRRKPVVGDLRWDGQVWRRWSGRRWAQAAYSLRPARLLTATPFGMADRVDDARRQRAVMLAVEDQVVTNSANVLFEGPNGVVLGYRRPVAHFLHLVLTIVTGGLWAIAWVSIAISAREERVRLETDPWGNVWARPVGRS